MTTEYNSLQGGSVGQIAAQYTFSGVYMGKTVKWMHYDRLGNLMNKSGTTGFGTDTYYQDAYGNVLSSITTGAWASNPSGRHLTTKEIDWDVPLYYFWQRWYEPTTGRFVSRAPFPPFMEHPYGYALESPNQWVDAEGELAVIPIIRIGILVRNCGASYIEMTQWVQCMLERKERTQWLEDNRYKFLDKGRIDVWEKMKCDNDRSKSDCNAGVRSGNLAGCLMGTQGWLWKLIGNVAGNPGLI